MKKTGLKEMFMVRYADDFRIFCRTKDAAKRTKTAVAQWLYQRLRLEVSEEKTRVVNVKRRYSEFLGFKLKVHPKGNKQVVKSHICDKRLQTAREKLVTQAKRIIHPPHGRTELDEIRLYNSMVMGIQEYYKIATNVNLDCRMLNRAVMLVLTNGMKSQNGQRLKKTGRKLTKIERMRYGQSSMLRYAAGSEEPIYPIGYVQNSYPRSKRYKSCYYSEEGRIGSHENLRINVALMLTLMRQASLGYSTEYADNRISLFSAQWGKCAITGHDFTAPSEIHCHHKKPRHLGGSDQYANLVLVSESVHKLIHAKEPITILKYLSLLNLSDSQMEKVNHLRSVAGLPAIS